MVLFQSAHHTGGGLELCCSPQFPFPACSPHALAWSCWNTSFINPLDLPYCLQLPRGACPISLYSFKQMHRMRFCPQGGWFITENTPVLEPIEHGDRMDWDFPTEASGSFLGFYTWPVLPVPLCTLIASSLLCPDSKSTSSHLFWNPFCLPRHHLPSVYPLFSVFHVLSTFIIP